MSVESMPMASLTRSLLLLFSFSCFEKLGWPQDLRSWDDPVTVVIQGQITVRVPSWDSQRPMASGLRPVPNSCDETEELSTQINTRMMQLGNLFAVGNQSAVEGRFNVHLYPDFCIDWICRAHFG